MFVRLTKTFTFEAAHFLPSFPEGHKCRRMHGHSFRVDVIVAGEVPAGEHHLVDYGDPFADALDSWSHEADRIAPTFDAVWDPLDSCAGPGGFDYEPDLGKATDTRLGSIVERVRRRPPTKDLVSRMHADLAKILESQPD